MSASTVRVPRVAFYSHDTMGLGHMRRNLLLAGEIAELTPHPSTLLITGTREVARFTLPRGVDLLSLPALYKDASAKYHARTLNVALDEIIALRSAIIQGAIETFAPDVFIVDNVPRGALGELEPTLRMLRRGGRTRCVLGLRDILDDPTHVRAEWNRAGNVATIRQYYDAVWVYGDESVLDVAAEYDLPADVRRRMHYTGYLDQRRRAAAPATPAADTHDVVCLLGGGQDGLPLARAFLQAEFPAPWQPLLVTGPMMSPTSRAEVARLAALAPDKRIVEFVDDPAALMRSARAVITMGGYNTVCDVLSHDVRALVVPRVVPRTEQLIRASRLAERGLLEMLHPDALTPEALRDWVCTPPDIRTPRPVRLHEGPAIGALVRSLVPAGSAEVRHAS
ncbi:MAG: glycosyltransferase [Gemmatimonadetes bacterium]|nr:glycosyltransferase [Gemmatimonadota bacterium]